MSSFLVLVLRLSTCLKITPIAATNSVPSFKPCPPKMKTPKFLSKLSAVLTPRPKKKLQATARAARHTMEDYDAEEPTTKLSSAFVVVLILHLVAVGGIYAFNSIKASRRDRDPLNKPAEVVASAA